MCLLFIGPYGMKIRPSGFYLFGFPVSAFWPCLLRCEIWHVVGALDECFESICGPWRSVDNTETIRAVLFWFFIHQSQLVPLYLTWLIFRDLTFWDWEHFIPKIAWSLAKNVHKQYGTRPQSRSRCSYFNLCKISSFNICEVTTNLKRTMTCWIIIIFKYVFLNRNDASAYTIYYFIFVFDKSCAFETW